MTDSRLTLNIYSRPECHLCDDLVTALKPWRSRYSFELNIINIDEDEQLTAKFAARIPVLTHGDTEICQYYLDESAIQSFFNDRSAQIS